MTDGVLPIEQDPTLQEQTLPTEQQSTTAAEQAPTPYTRRKSGSLKLTKEEEEDIVKFVLERFKEDEEERQDWMQRRKDRIAKTRGWLPEKNWPFEGASNLWAPVIATACYRVISALQNAVLGQRPAVQSKAKEKKLEPNQGRIDNLLDHQVFMESRGEERLGDFANHFVFDGLSIAHIAYVKETRTVSDVRILQFDAKAAALYPDAVFPEVIQGLLTDNKTKVISAKVTSEDKWTWKAEIEVSGETITATIDFFERDDGLLEATIRRPMVTHDGPVFNVEEIENIVVPARCSNLQPPGPANPHGAPYVNRLFSVRMDEIWQHWKKGIYDLIDEDKWNVIRPSKPPIGTNSSQAEQRDQELDIHEGTMPQVPRGTTAEERFYPIEGIEHYGRWIINKDENGDGEEVDVIFSVLKDSKQLVRARFLTEIHPGNPPMRPFAEARYIRVPNRFYAIGLCELLEPIQDLIKILLDSNMDWGTIRNMPWFTYRASSGLNPEVLRMRPGEGYPLDDPSRDINIPQWGNSDNSWVFNTLSLAQQMGEKLAMESDFNYGRVPSGKASAMRTVGTTVALLQQGDVRQEQVLRALFDGIVQIYRSFHRLNRRWLPQDKEFRIIGIPEQDQSPYMNITPQDIDGEVDFDFTATMMNTNRQAMAEALTEAIGIVVSPLALQLGIVGPDQVYRLMKDRMKARDLDYKSYLKPPTPDATKPGITVEEAIGMIMDGLYPYGSPLEGPIVHFQRLIEFQQDDHSFGRIDTPDKVNLFAFYLRDVHMQVQQLMKQQQMAQAASQMQQFMGQQGQDMSGEGTPTTIQQPQPRGPMNGGLTPEAKIGGVQ